ARALLEVRAREGTTPEAATVLVRPGAGADAATARGLPTVTDAAGLISARPDLVVECAGQGAVAAHVADCLRAGIDTVVASVGALADAGLHEALLAAARGGGGRLILPAGAIGAVDLLSALRPSGIERLTYAGRKPPAAWAGTPPAADTVDLGALASPVTLFEGDARAAALAYPKNANVAATLALAGPGFAATEVRLVADPGIARNVHEIAVRAGAADFEIRIEGHPAPGNPRTSLATVHSLAREIANRSREVAI
ncbi:MAG: aspartate dehydrogenase, partial [Roseicyclus sp.]